MTPQVLRYAPLPILFVLLYLGAPVHAARPSEELLPATTKAFVAVPDVDELRARFDATQIGTLANDPVMQPFVEDLKRQIQAKLNRTNGSLGLNWNDLENVYGGEVAVAAIQPWNEAESAAAIEEAVAKTIAQAKADGKGAAQLKKIAEGARQAAREQQDELRRKQHATVMLVDVTGHLAEASELLAKLDKEFKSRNAIRGTLNVGNVTMTAYTLPKKQDEPEARQAFFVLLENRLIAADHAEVARQVVTRAQAPANDSLAAIPAFAAAMTRSAAAFGELQPHVRWFIEPFGYVEVSRASSGGRRKRGTDMLRVLANQGFTAIEGVGGYVAFDTADCEVLHRTIVYAPPAENPTAGGRYTLAANILDFPNGGSLQPQNWIPRELGMYATFNWRTQKAFYAAETLVNEIAGDEVFDDVLDSIQNDPNGPQVNIQSDLVAHLGERATMISDYRMPVTPKSERLLFAVEVTDPIAVARTVNKAMQSDPAAKRRDFGDLIIWEILNEEPVEVATLQIDGDFGFGGFDKEIVEEVEEKPLIPNSAVTVAFGHLIVASHVDYIVDVLKNRAQPDHLSTAADYHMVQAMLDRLGAGDGSFRMFNRMDETCRVTYELFREGKMPESESLLGKLLNRIWEPEEEGVLREPRLEGDKLPDYQIVRRYLGPGGLFVQTENDGWTIGGCLLSKQAE